MNLQIITELVLLKLIIQYCTEVKLSALVTLIVTEEIHAILFFYCIHFIAIRYKVYTCIYAHIYQLHIYL